MLSLISGAASASVRSLHPFDAPESMGQTMPLGRAPVKKAGSIIPSLPDDEEEDDADEDGGGDVDRGPGKNFASHPPP